MEPKQVIEFAKKNNAEMVDLKFMDFPGMWQHFSVPLHELEEDSFEDSFFPPLSLAESPAPPLSEPSFFPAASPPVDLRA